MTSYPTTHFTEFAPDARSSLHTGSGKRSLLTALGEHLAYTYVICASFFHYLPHVPGIDVNVVNVIVVLLYLIAATKSVSSYRGVGLTNAVVAFWIISATALYSLRNSQPTHVFREVSTLATFISLIIILGSADTHVPLDRWVRRLLWLGSLQGLVAIGIFYGWIPAPDDVGPRAFHGDRTGFIIDGVFGLVAEVAGLWTLAAYRGRRLLVLAVGAIILGLANSVLSGFRSYAAAAAGLMLVSMISAVVRRDRRLVGIQAAIVAALIAVALADPAQRVAAMEQRILDVRDYDTSLIWRQIEKTQELYLINQRPWLGHGWGLSSTLQVSYIGDMPSYGHNFYTSAPARIGIPISVYLALSWLTLAVEALRRSLRFTSGSQSASCWYIAAAVVMIALVSTVQNVVTMSRAFPVFAIFVVQILAEKRSVDVKRP